MFHNLQFDAFVAIDNDIFPIQLHDSGKGLGIEWLNVGVIGDLAGK